MPVVFESRDKMSAECSQDNSATSSEYFQLLEVLLRGAISDAEQEMGDMISSYVELDGAFQSLKKQIPEADLLKFEHYFSRLLENMQFFDSLSQRVDHVAEALNSVASSTSMSDGEAGVALAEQQIKKSYTTAAEHHLHEDFFSAGMKAGARVRSLGE